jgi:hypothetical protein
MLRNSRRLPQLPTRASIPAIRATAQTSQIRFDTALHRLTYVHFHYVFGYNVLSSADTLTRRNFNPNAISKLYQVHMKQIEESPVKDQPISDQSSSSKLPTILAIIAVSGIVIANLIAIVASKLNANVISRLFHDMGTWDQLLYTPLIFAVIGLIGGRFARRTQGLRKLVLWSLVWGVVGSVVVLVGSDKLLTILSNSSTAMGVDIGTPVAVPIHVEIALTVLWTTWGALGTSTGIYISRRPRREQAK